MSAPNAFDEQARRKLAEREHPFDEAAWASLQPALDAQREQRRKRRFILWSTFALGVGIAGWWMIRKEEPMVDLTTTHVVNAPQTTGTEDFTQVKDEVVATRLNEAKERATVRSGSKRNPGSPELHPPADPLHHASGPIRMVQVGDGNSASPDPGMSITADPSLPPETGAPVGSLLDDDPHRSIDKPRSPGPVDPPTFLETPPIPATDAGSTTGAMPAQNDVQDSTTANVPERAPVVGLDPLRPDTAEDTARYAVTGPATAIDTNHTNKPGTQVLELSAWGGLFRSSTTYIGDRTMAWASRVGSARTSAFGGEVMRQGRSFGYGAGLHYTSYVEQLESEQLQEETRRWITAHHLNAVDTTILVVNGTVWLNGQQYYVTQSVDTTLHVLVTNTAEEVRTDVRRNALDRRNRVNYLEIPLLLEAHQRWGQWSLGVRGGPTLGILQGRRGALPTTNGYTDLASETFNDLVIGWGLQGHVRYHCGTNWSVALGPSLRGQWQNSVHIADLQRRSQATGIILSVSYYPHH